MNAKWYFATDTTEDEIFSDANAELFTNNSSNADVFRSISRELIQNSIDAKIEKEKKTKITFDFIEIEKEKFPEVNGLFDHIKGTIDYCERTERKNVGLNNSRNQIDILKKDKYLVLKVSDYNTKGVEGSNEPNLNSKNKWRGLLYNEGDSIKDSNTSLGSHGLGKNAAFSLSGLRTVFYVTRDLDNNYAMEGVAKLCTSYIEGIKKHNKGYFCNEVNGKTSPLTEEQAIEINPIFARKESGTDIYIVEPNLDLVKNRIKYYLIESVISNFFVAFFDDKLTVIINGEEINNKNYQDKFKEVCQYYEDNGISESLQMTFVRQYLETIKSGQDHSFDLDGFGKIEFYLLKNDEIIGKKYAIFRDRGMIITEFDVKSASQKFSGVVIVRGDEGTEFLRSIEDPNHKGLDPSRSTTETNLSPEERQDKLNRLLERLKDEIKKFTFIQSTDSITLTGMEDYIQMPDDVGGVFKDSSTVKIKQIKRNRRKEKEYLFEKDRVVEEQSGYDIPSLDHHESEDPNPNPNDYEPNKVSIIKDNNSEKKNFIKNMYVGFEIEPIMKIDGKFVTLIFKTTNCERLLKMKIFAVGEDGLENNYMPNLIAAFDENQNKELPVVRSQVLNVDSKGITKIKLTFDSEIESRLKIYLFWEDIVNERN